MPVNYGHHRSDRVAEILHPVLGIRDAMRRAGKTPHDHTKDNRMHIKALQAKGREKRAAAEAAAEAAVIKPSPRFAAVGSRVASELARPATAPAEGVRKSAAPAAPPNFACPKPSGPPGRIFTAWSPPPLQNEGLSTSLPRRAKMKPAVPAQKPAAAKQPPIDFVKRNAELAAMSPRKASIEAPSPPGTGDKSRYHGRLPPYLIDRKLEMARAAAAEAAAREPRECPEGTHVLPEDERVKVLEMVAEGQTRLHKQLDAMPFVVDT